MIDIKARQDENGAFFVGFENGDFEHETGFDTAIYISLFTDARANESQVLTPEYRRGWLADIESPVNGRQLGSYLWLLDQSRLTPSTLNLAISYAQKALNWLVEDGIASFVKVTGAIVPRQGITLTIVITSSIGKTSTHYVNLWENTGNA